MRSEIPAAGEDRLVAVAAEALDRVAAELPSERPLILAVCDYDGRPTDLLVRNRRGGLAVLAGVPEDRRPALSGIVGLDDSQLEAHREPQDGPENVTPQTCDVAEVGLLTRTLVEHTPVPLMLVDRDGVIAYASAFMRDFGYRAGGLVGNRLIHYVHPDDRERLGHLQDRIARGARAGTIDLRWRREDGGHATVEARIRTSGERRGPLVGALVVALQPLPRPWTGPAELIAAAHRQRALADAADCGVAIVSGASDMLGIVLEANGRLGRIVGTSTGQLIGSPLTSLVADADAARLLSALDAIGDRSEPYVLEVALKHSLGSGRRAEITVRVNPDETELQELILCVRDITEQLRLVAELSAAVDRLERTNHELAEFARITAHDLSAPLLALSRLVELLSDRGEDPEFAPTVGAIRSGISRMRGMVDSVMGYAQSLEAAPARAPVDLDDVLAHVLDVLAEEVARRRANITASELPTVPGDEQQLERVLLNLVSNALKFAGERPPRISVTAHRQQRMWWISVSDEGIGVAEADRAHIFDLFARSRSSASGRGIGLATCRRIIELHGGRIWVEPNEPRGSIFHFTLPTEPTVSSG